MAQPTLTPREFARKWGDNETKEKAASQEHFIDLCRMLGEPTPNEADPTGTIYAFEKSVTKAAGGDGFADVWKKDFFGWEYKGKGKDLKAARLQTGTLPVESPRTCGTEGDDGPPKPMIG